ncbi:MAG: CCA tRNA nucleotidyltransferase [Alphaproteobacteria bacterium]|nr:CCA tRNA nucleotidyltransferase [Alphaproteobacteria bacterium]MCD8519831.1 CCA tRNA nucleotidyltransferase [Alphaproteobacteria bacterium]
MKPVTTIPVQDWMKMPETKAVMGPLNKNSDEPMALFVGGCIRNALLGIDVGDIDIATKFTPQQVVDIMGKSGIKTVPTGIEHGTVTAVSNHKPYEITTLRRDVKTDGRRAVVAFSDSWEEDAYRRDFTMNTLLADDAGNVYDPTGQGVSDLKAGRVVFVGDAAERIAEDVLRILRFFRFHALYGKGAPDEAALAACCDQADKISTLSRERITQEFFKILSVTHPVDNLGIIFKNGILKEFHYPDYNPDLLSFFCDHAFEFSLAGRLFIFFAQSVDNIKTQDKMLIIPKALVRELEAIERAYMKALFDTEAGVKTALYRYGRAAVKAVLVIKAGQGALDKSALAAYRDITENWDIPVFR